MAGIDEDKDSKVFAKLMKSLESPVNNQSIEISVEILGQKFIVGENLFFSRGEALLKIDYVLFSSLKKLGVFDLHPGNFKLNTDGKLILFDAECFNLDQEEYSENSLISESIKEMEKKIDEGVRQDLDNQVLSINKQNFKDKLKETPFRIILMGTKDYYSVFAYNLFSKDEYLSDQRFHDFSERHKIFIEKFFLKNYENYDDIKLAIQIHSKNCYKRGDIPCFYRLKDSILFGEDDEKVNLKERSKDV